MAASFAHVGPDASPSFPAEILACWREEIWLDSTYLDVKISEWIRPEFTYGWS